MVQTITSPLTYMSVLLDIPPEDADAAFDRCRTDLTSRTAKGRGRWSIELEGARVELRGGGRRCEPPRPSAVWPLRVVGGTLRSRGAVWRVPVELQLFPWSEARTELGLRPARRWLPRFLVAEPYFLYGRAALEQLGSEIVEWAHAARESSAWRDRLAG
jgi:hypothetical protein